MTDARTHRPIPLGLTLLIATVAALAALAFSGGVNFTAGMKYVRTSPDHGTAYDLAGKNQANESSFREAIYTAIDIFRRRNEWEEISADPLKPQPRQKEGRERER